MQIKTVKEQQSWVNRNAASQDAIPEATQDILNSASPRVQHTSAPGKQTPQVGQTYLVSKCD